MAKRKATRKKAAKSAGSKASKARTVQKKAKLKRTSKPSPAKKKAKRAAGKTPVKQTTPSKKVKKKISKAPPAKKKTAKKATAKTPVSKKTAKKATTKTPVSKKRAKKAPAEPGLPLKEIRARLGLIGPQIGQLEWLEGLYLYGSKIRDVPRLEHVDFIAVYRGLRNAARLKAAETELQELLAAVLPLDFDLKFTGTLEIGRLLQEGNPAAQALLGYAEPIFTRGD